MTKTKLCVVFTTYTEGINQAARTHARENNNLRRTCSSNGDRQQYTRNNQVVILSLEAERRHPKTAAKELVPTLYQKGAQLLYSARRGKARQYCRTLRSQAKGALVGIRSSIPGKHYCETNNIPVLFSIRQYIDNSTTSLFITRKHAV